MPSCPWICCIQTTGPRSPTDGIEKKWQLTIEGCKSFSHSDSQGFGVDASTEAGNAVPPAMLLDAHYTRSLRMSQLRFGSM